jgi:two-component system, response regulator, stage 0 sporulation protein F
MAHVLVVDDDDSIRFLLREELLTDGHTVRTAADGSAGLTAVGESLPDVVVLDIKMPGISGLEVLGRLKKEYPRLPVLLMTAYGDYRSEAANLGADGYFVKSPNLEALKDAIRRSTS